VNFARRHTHHRLLRVEITPMIDVVFLLIIFFMTTAQFARMTRAEVELPRQVGEQRQEPEAEGIVINITADGQIIVANETVTIDELEQLVFDEVQRTRGRDALTTRVMIRADRRASTRHLNRVVERLRKINIGAARIGTEVP
jgi:biopolymer transport protein ExbD